MVVKGGPRMTSRVKSIGKYCCVHNQHKLEVWGIDKWESSDLNKKKEKIKHIESFSSAATPSRPHPKNFVVSLHSLITMMIHKFSFPCKVDDLMTRRHSLIVRLMEFLMNFSLLPCSPFDPYQVYLSINFISSDDAANVNKKFFFSFRRFSTTRPIPQKCWALDKPNRRLPFTDEDQISKKKVIDRFSIFIDKWVIGGWKIWCHSFEEFVFRYRISSFLEMKLKVDSSWTYFCVVKCMKIPR